MKVDFLRKSMRKKEQYGKVNIKKLLNVTLF